MDGALHEGRDCCFGEVRSGPHGSFNRSLSFFFTHEFDYRVTCNSIQERRTDQRNTRIRDENVREHNERMALKTMIVGFAVQASQALGMFFINNETCIPYCRCYNQPQNLDPCFEARYIVNPTYPPNITTIMSTIFIKTSPHPRLWSSPLFPEKGVDALFLPPLLPLPSVFARSEVSLMCMFHVSTAMIS